MGNRWVASAESAFSSGIELDQMENDMKASSFGIALATEREFFHPRLLRALAVAVVTHSTGGLGSVYAGEPLADEHDFLNDVASPSFERRTVELEELFWMCDYASSVGDLDVAQAEQCEAVKEHLKRDKFVGDSEKLLAWWRLNKDVAHRKLAAVRSEASECVNVAHSEARSQP